MVPRPFDITNDSLRAEGESTVGVSWHLQFLRNSPDRDDSAGDSLVGAGALQLPCDSHANAINSEGGVGMLSRNGRALSVSASQPTEGPGGCGDVSASGYLGFQTQAESLDASWNKSRRLSDGETRRSAGSADEEPDPSHGEEAEGAAPVTVPHQTEDETDQLESSAAEVKATRVYRAEGRDDGRESQKENTVFRRNSLAPDQPSMPLGLRNSYSNLEPTPSAPSSSPVVALQLLNGTRGRSDAAPSSSDPLASAEGVHAPTRNDVDGGKAEDVSWTGDLSVSASAGPITSTPGVYQALLPEPAPTQAPAPSRARSIPTYQFVSHEGSDLSHSHSRPLRVTQTAPVPALAQRRGGGGGTVPDLSLFGSSAAMAKPVSRGKKRKEEWDGISQDTPEEQRLAKRTHHETQETEFDSSSFAPTQVHEEQEQGQVNNGERGGEGEEDEEEEERDPTPRPTAEQTISMDLDDGDSRPYINGGDIDDGGEGGTLDASTIHGDLDSIRQPNESPEGDRRSEPWNEQDLPRNQAAEAPHVLPSGSSNSSSPSTSQVTQPPRLDSSAQQAEPPSKKRLSDISEIRSSQEFPPTQFEVEATQKVYDAEKSQNSINSVNMDVLNSATWHAPFAHDNSTMSSDSRQRLKSVPAGRELRRVPPPPTPVLETSRASSPLKQSLQASDGNPFQPVSGSSPADTPTIPAAAVASSSDPTSHHSNSTAEDSLALPVPPPHFHPLPSTLPSLSQATQQVAESSPDVPLAKAQLRHQASAAMTSGHRPSRSLSRQLSPPSALRAQPDHHSPPSNEFVVVPDSEGPTQNDDEKSDERRQTIENGDSKAGSATAVQQRRGDDSEQDSLTDLEEVSLEEMVAASRTRRSTSHSTSKPQKRRGGEGEADDTPKVDRKGKGKAKGVEAERDVSKKGKTPAPAASERVQVSNGKLGESPESRVEKVVKRGKGKQKAVVVVDEQKSTDDEEEDRQRKSKSRERKKAANGKTSRGTKRAVFERREEDEENSSEGELADEYVQEETSSDKPKGQKNSKKPSPKKQKKKVETRPAVAAPLPARTPRRRASGPTIIEQTTEEEDDDDEEEEEPVPAVSRSRRKRKSSPRPEEQKPAPKRSKRSTAPSETKAVNKPTSRLKKASVAPSRMSTTPRQSRASTSAEPDRPVAGPSRARLTNRDEGQGDEGDEEMEDEDEDEREVDTKPSITGSKLAPSAPFSRCFGLWRDDGYFYPGTILSVGRELFTVKFDDGSQGRLRLDEVRRCELAEGDWIEYSWPEKGRPTETQSEEHLSGDFRVLHVKKGGPVEDNTDDEDDEIEGQLDKRDSIIAVNAPNYDRRGAGGRRQKFLVEAIRVIGTRSSQFDDRRVSPLDLLAFEGNSLPRANKPLPILAAGPSRPSIKAFEDNPTNKGLFGRIAFLVTYASGSRANVAAQGSSNSAATSATNGDSTAFKGVRQIDKDRFFEKLKAHGATLIDWEHLFEARIPREGGGTPEVTFPKRDFAEIDTILLLADRATTTMKYLTALALGIPCCSVEFANATIKEGTRIDFHRYLLSSGYLDPLRTFGIGGQLRAARKLAFDLGSLEKGQKRGGTFAGQSFLVVMEKPGKKADEKTQWDRRAYMILSLLACGSAKRVDFLTLPLDGTAPSKSLLTDFANSIASTYTHVYLDFEDSNAKLERLIKPLVANSAAIHHRAGLVNMGWIKLCLQTGHLEPPERVKKHQE